MSTEKAATLKFASLALGARFRWRNADYVKVSPLIARDESTGAPQMIQRAALVEPLDVITADAAVTSSRTEGVFEEYHRTALACLETLAATASAEDAAQVRRRLDDARRRALQKLGKSG